MKAAGDDARDSCRIQKRKYMALQTTFGGHFQRQHFMSQLQFPAEPLEIWGGTSRDRGLKVKNYCSPSLIEAE